MSWRQIIHPITVQSQWRLGKLKIFDNPVFCKFQHHFKVFSKQYFLKHDFKFNMYVHQSLKDQQLDAYCCVILFEDIKGVSLSLRV